MRIASETTKGRNRFRPFELVQVELHRDSAIRARIDAGTALGAVVRAVELGDLFEVVAAARTFIDADATSRTVISVHNGQRHVSYPFNAVRF